MREVRVVTSIVCFLLDLSITTAMVEVGMRSFGLRTVLQSDGVDEA